MNRDLVRHIAEQTGRTQTEVRAILDLFWDTIHAAVIGGEEIRLPHIGTFYRKSHAGMRVVLPNGTETHAPPSVMVAFRPASALKRRLR